LVSAVIFWLQHIIKGEITLYSAGVKKRRAPSFPFWTNAVIVFPGSLRTLPERFKIAFKGRCPVNSIISLLE
jgi:hypothetical protein